MARPIRIERAGGWYHLTARGNERRAIYRDHRDRQHFGELLVRLEAPVSRRICLHLTPRQWHVLDGRDGGQAVGSKLEGRPIVAGGPPPGDAIVECLDVTLIPSSFGRSAKPTRASKIRQNDACEPSIKVRNHPK